MTLPLLPQDLVKSRFPSLLQSSKENTCNPNYLCTQPLIWLPVKPFCLGKLGKADGEFKLPLISGEGLSVLINSEVYAVVRVEGRKGLKE